MTTVLEIGLDDVVRLRKVHPCGGTDWQVYRLGADIGLRCLTCGRRVMLERAVLEKRIKQFLSRASLDGAPQARDGDVTHSRGVPASAPSGRDSPGKPDR